MKPLIVLLVAAGTAAAQAVSTPATPLKPNAQRSLFRGPVHIVHEEINGLCIRPASECPPPLQVSDTTFDPGGWETEATSSFRGQPTFHTVWQRDGARLIRTESESTGPKGTTRQITRYDAQGRPLELLKYADGKLRERTTRIYDEKGIVETTYDGDGRMLDTYIRHTQAATSDGKTTSEVLTDNEVESRTVIQPTANGKHREYTSYNREGQVNYQTVEDSSAQGTTVTLSDKNGYGYTSKTDAAGHLIEQTTFLPQERSAKKYFGEDGRLTKYETYDAAHKVTSTTEFSYQDDEHGNWIVRTETLERPGEDPIIIRMTTRTITYY